MTSLTSDIDRWITGHDCWSSATRNRYKTTIRRAYSLAMKSHKVRTNPVGLWTIEMRITNVFGG